MQVFDITHSPDLIRPAYWLIGLFWCVGLFMAVFGIGILKHEKRDGSDYSKGMLRNGRRAAWFSLLWILITAWASYSNIHAAMNARHTLATGRYPTLEGCLSYFDPGEVTCRRGGRGAERWKVGDREFSYCGDSVTFAYHSTEAGGGIVHSDSWVRVSYIAGGLFGGDDIVRMEGKPGICAPAPLPGS